MYNTDIVPRSGPVAVVNELDISNLRTLGTTQPLKGTDALKSATYENTLLEYCNTVSVFIWIFFLTLLFNNYRSWVGRSRCFEIRTILCVLASGAA